MIQYQDIELESETFYWCFARDLKRWIICEYIEDFDYKRDGYFAATNSLEEWYPTDFDYIVPIDFPNPENFK